MNVGIVVTCLASAAPFSADEPKPRATLKGHTDSIESLAFSTDGKTLASGSTEKSIKLWDVATGKNTNSLEIADAESSALRSVALSPDGQILASLSIWNDIRLWNIATGKSTTIRKRPGCTERGYKVIFSADGKTLAAWSDMGEKLELWDVANRKCTAVLNGRDDYFRAMAFTPDSKTLASMSREGIKLWDVPVVDKRKAPTPKTGDNEKTADKKQIEKLISDLGSAEVVEQDKAAKELENLGPLARDMLVQATRHRSFIIQHRAGKLLELLEERADAERAALEKERAALERKPRTVTPLADDLGIAAFSPDGKTVAAVIDKVGQRRVKLWTVATGKEQTNFKVNTDWLWCLALSSDGKTLASGDAEGTIQVWDVTAGKELAAFKGNRGWVACIAFSPDGKTLASGGADRVIRLWDVPKGK